MKRGIIITGVVLVLAAGLWFYLQKPGNTEDPEVAPEYRAQLSALRTRVKDNPQDTVSYLALGRLMQHNGHAARAAHYYQHYVDLRPQNRQVWQELTNSLIEANHLRQAVVAADGFVAQFPGDEQALYNLGLVRLKIGDYDRAKEIWTRLKLTSQDTLMVRRAAVSLRDIDAR